MEWSCHNLYVNFNHLQTVTEYKYVGLLGCKAFLNNEYVPVHNCNMAKEAAILGVISLSLTLLNITCIIIMGIVVLKVSIHCDIVENVYILK